jgi:hypothetical protein
MRPTDDCSQPAPRNESLADHCGSLALGLLYCVARAWGLRSPHLGHSGIHFVQKFDALGMNQIYKTMVSSEVPGLGAQNPELGRLSLDAQGGQTTQGPKRNGLSRVLLVAFGIILGQAILYGPSLVGRKVLLPLDILGAPGVYLPRTGWVTNIEPHNASLTDLVYVMEPQRRFAVSELSSGRLPAWAPYEFGGVPFIWPKFSPFLFLQSCIASPVVLAWSQLCQGLVAGLGIYFFIRRGLQLGFWAAALCAMSYPMTAYFILWQGFLTSLPVTWLPWILLAIDRTVRRSSPLAPIWLGLTTCLVLVSGPVDIAGQVLLGSGLYALWCLVGQGVGKSMTLQVGRTLLCVALGWVLGFALATPYLLPVMEYARTGARMEKRAGGAEERSPIGISALPQVVLPDMYGTMETGSLRSAPDHQAESSAAGYVGLIATLVAAPLAFCNRRYSGRNVFWVMLTVFSLSWCLNLFGFTEILRLPGLNMFSHNRMVFLAGFALLMLAAEGLEALASGPVTWSWWMWLPSGLLAGLCLWCWFRTFHLPTQIQTTLAEMAQGSRLDSTRTMDSVKRIYASYVGYYTAAGVWCAMGLLGWITLRARPQWHAAFLPVLGGVFFLELLCFGYGKNVQCELGLYYPEIPALKQLAKCPPGRIMGYGCLPPTLSAMCGLQDIRGYDAVDPARMVKLVLKASDPRSPKIEYALTQQLRPNATMTSEGTVQLMPVLDMLSVRYVVFRGPLLPLAKPILQGPDYWVLENPRALPRVFVPHHTEVVTNDTDRLERLASDHFNPREVAYVETAAELPESCRGTAQIVEETPTLVKVSAQMETSGMVVLGDRWDKGWHSYLNGKEVPILRANHAVRGVVVPSGNWQLEFRYKPASLELGLRVAAFSAGVLLVWVGFVGWRKLRTSTAEAFPVVAVPNI